MATYLVLFSFTQQGVEKIKESPSRVEAAKKVVRDMGGEVRAFYAILGSDHDTLFIVEAPNDEKIAQMVLSIAKSGNVRTRTHRLFNEEEFSRIARELP